MAVSSTSPGYFASNPQTICKQVDTHFSDLTKLHELDPERYPFLLQSNASIAGDDHPCSETSRYDILFAFPAETIKKRLDGSCIHSEKGSLPGTFTDLLDQHWNECRTEQTGTNLPFTGGWFLYLGYELAGEIEPGLQLPAATPELPVACAVRIPAAVILDRALDQLWLVAEREHAELLESLDNDIQRATSAGSSTVSTIRGKLEEDKPDQYLAAVERIKDYIYEGDVFQVNLSRQWQFKPDTDLKPVALYRNLCMSNPAPFAGLARIDQVHIISSSPERLVRTRGLQIDTRPIAGTRPRSVDSASDQALSEELMAHPKEQAEHIMLIDLERNDLGRVSQPGSIQVNELMGLESYAHVHHIVSNVRGQLIPGTTPGQIIRAVFPGGTITGCPKVRCMEIIAELEQTARGAYTGSMGYLNRNGDMDLNILIRTLVQSSGSISLRAGAGIVADSDPLHELAETRAKARGLLMAIGGSAS